jgi:hypothetical protein
MLTDEQLQALREELHHRHANADAEGRDRAHYPARRKARQARAEAFAETLALIAAIEQGRPYRN